MTDDRNNDQSAGGFDDWLDDEPGPPTDPHEMLASETNDEAGGAEEAADEEAAAEEAADEEVEDETAEIEVVAVSDDEEAAPAEDESDGSDGSADTAPEDVGDDDADDDVDDTGELEVVRPPDQGSGGGDALASDSEDTHEFGSVAAVGFGALWDTDDDDGDASTSDRSSPDLFDMTREDYLHTATKEHEGLAESIAAADDEDTEQVALAAPIPGLDATVVGFEDVVKAEGLGRTRARASGDLIARIVTAVVLVAALAASLLWQPALVALALAVFVLGAGEFYTALSRSGHKPIALFGFVGIVGASLGAYFGSALWIPLAFVLVVTALLLFYAVVPGRSEPMSNLALTTIVMVWVGLGSFTMLIAKADSYRTLVMAVVVTVAAMDIAQYFFGRALGRHKLSPWVSPKKTVEGLVAGIIVAVTIGALLHFFPPFEMTSGLALGVAVAIFAPMGDLAMSAAKRSLGLKDMGSVLPGHGGFLDRIDGLLFVIPVAWAIFVWAGIL